MQEINIYKTTEESFRKIFSKLIESIVAQNIRCYLYCNDSEEEKSLDYLLWSYSQLSFIPHGTALDPYSEEQMVLLGIEPKLAPQNKATIFLAILTQDLLKGDFLEFLIQQYDKVLFFDKNNFLNIQGFKNLRTQIHIIQQDSTGKWIKQNIT